MLRLETSTLRLVPPPPSIKPHPSVPADYDAETRLQGSVWDLGPDKISPGLQPPEAPTNVRVVP